MTLLQPHRQSEPGAVLAPSSGASPRRSPSASLPHISQEPT